MLTFSMAVPRMCAAAVLMLILAPGLARAQEVSKGWPVAGRIQCKRGATATGGVAGELSDCGVQ